MTQEDKELLLKDLCARLPYRVFIQYHWSRKGNTIEEDRELDFSDVETLKYNIENPQNDWCEISWKPYLRPMSTMTEEEFKELTIATELQYDQLELMDWGNDKTLEFYLSEIPQYCVIKVFDWLNKKMFDYRGLIQKGLALEALKGMYNFDEE